MKSIKIRHLLTTALLFVASSSHAALINWTDWQSANSNVSPSNSVSTVDGQINTGTGSVSVGKVGTTPYSFVDLGNGVTNFWGPSNSNPVITAFNVNGVDQSPVMSDIIALNGGGTVTINFGQQVTDAYIALVSWNGQFNSPAMFDKEIEIVSSGIGYWGTGSATLTQNNTAFTTTGEYHGIIKVLGTYSSFSFTHRSENWHGFTVGLASQDVNEPQLFLLLAGALGLIAIRRKTKRS